MFNYLYLNITPLIYAILKNNVEIVKILLTDEKHSSYIDVNKKLIIKKDVY